MFKPMVAALVGVLSVSSLSAAPAGMPDTAAAQKVYADMCKKSVDWPKGHGESDLKGNPKLDAYCTCFSEKFLERAMKAAQTMKDAPTSLPSAEETARGEFEMRASCRAKLDLPPPAKKA